jgi:hypothetical protein
MEQYCNWCGKKIETTSGICSCRWESLKNIEPVFVTELKDKECEHKFILLETIRKSYYENHCTKFVRIDRFYCEKCLEQKETRKEDWCRETPEWY